MSTYIPMYMYTYIHICTDISLYLDIHWYTLSTICCLIYIYIYIYIKSYISQPGYIAIPVGTVTIACVLVCIDQYVPCGVGVYYDIP